MGEALFEWLRGYFSAELAVFFTAWFPIAELRLAIPLGVSLGVDPFTAFLLGILGNMVPVIPLLCLLKPVRKFLKQNFSLFKRFFDWLDQRTLKKSDKVDKYGALGLIFFTAVPLPTTGAWTASLAAVLFKIKFRYALPAIVTGVLIAGVVITLSSVFILV